MPIRTPVLLLAALTLLAGCDPAAEDTQQPSSEFAKADAPPAQPAPAAPSTSGARPGRWAGVVTEGYKGDSIQFTVTPAGRVQDVVFSGHWRCGPTPSSRTIKRMDVGHVPGAFAVGADGGFGGERKEPYLLWAVAGRFTGADAAAGTIRIEYHTECDTHNLSWTAAPAGA